MTNENQEILFYEKLLQVRKSKNIQINEISENTKINVKYIEAIERGDFDSLPNIYVRLFIRSYADYLGQDSKSILKKYEKHVNIKPKRFLKFKKNKEKVIKQNKISLHDKNKQSDISSNNQDSSSENEKHDTTEIKKSKPKNISFNLKNTFKKNNFNDKYFLSPKKIFNIFSTFSILAIIYLLVSYLSNQQRNNIVNQVETNNENINSEIKEINNSLMNNNDFNTEKLIQKKSFKLKNDITIPYIFQIVTKNKTKIYVSHDNESGNRIEDCNIIAPKDTLLKFENKKNIYFDLWNAKDVEMSINNKPISRYIKNENVLVRGSFEPTKKELYLEFYSH